MQSLPNTLELILVLLTQFLNSAPIPPEDVTGIASCKAAATANHQAVVDVVENDDRFWTAPYVLADLERKEVLVWGQATGMAKSDPVEFFVIGENSGHDYEALMISFARPSDIHSAMEKIGAQAGAPVFPTEHRFWPRGTRIAAEIEWKPDGADEPIRMPVEKLVMEKGAPMKPLPWVFTGSPTLPSQADPESMVYAADAFSPNSVASTFNLRNTVFDLPLQGTKTQTYGTFTRNPAITAAEGTPMLLRLRPAGPEEVPADVDLTIRFDGPDGALSVEGVEGLQAASLEELAEALKSRGREHHFVTVAFADELPLALIAELSQDLKLLEKHVESVRLEPPPAGHPYYQSFIPDPKFRDRTARPSQPIELHLAEEGDGLRGTVMELTEVWGDSRTPTVVEKRVMVESPEEWMDYLEAREEAVPVLFLYADGNRSYGKVRPWLSPVLDRFPVVFVYLNGN